jgi:hypothetical protein
VITYESSGVSDISEDVNGENVDDCGGVFDGCIIDKLSMGDVDDVVGVGVAETVGDVYVVNDADVGVAETVGGVYVENGADVGVADTVGGVYVENGADVGVAETVGGVYVANGADVGVAETVGGVYVVNDAGVVDGNRNGLGVVNWDCGCVFVLSSEGVTCMGSVNVES